MDGQILRPETKTMTRQDSQIIKGLAILLMIFLHLFNSLSKTELCHNLLYIDGTPLTLFLTRAANPVAFFLIIAGYGLYKVYDKGDKRRFARLIKLFIHYWITLLIFLPLAYALHGENYSWSLVSMLENLSIYNPTYNPEMWFLLPYVVLSATAPWLFKITKKIPCRYVILAALIIHVATSYMLSRYGSTIIYPNRWLYNIFVVFHFLLNFMLGAMSARYGFFEKLKAKFHKLRYIYIYIVILVVIQCSFQYNFFYAFIMISLINLARMPRRLRSTLEKLGNQSMDMWMVHSWLALYLFMDLFYSLSYPIVIFSATVVASYLVALLINRIAKPVESLILTKTEIKSKPIL